MTTVALTEADFERTIRDEPIVLVDFWASWCGPCVAFAPIYEAASEQHDDVVFAKVDTEQEQRLAGGLGIRSIPTVMAFRDGILVFRQAGMLPPASLEELVRQIRALDMDEVREEVARHQAEHAGDPAG